MDSLPEISQSFRADRRFPPIDGKGLRVQLDAHSLAIPDVKLIRTPRFSLSEKDRGLPMLADLAPVFE
jgi:hypothetical protein